MDTRQMIDIEEATRSLDFYAQLLNLQCDHYNVAAEPGLYLDADVSASPVTTIKDEMMSKLRASHKESLLLDIVLCQEMAREAKEQSVPVAKFSKVIEASSRMGVASRKAGDIIQEYDRKEAEKNMPPPKSALSEALQKLRKKLN